MSSFRMISKTAEYALRAVAWLAGHTERSHTAQQIAAATKVPSDYLAKVLKDLGRAGLVRAQPGRGGGFTLSRPADSVTVLEVTNAVDPIRRIRECPLALEEHATHLCPLHYRLDAIMALTEDAFRNCAITTLLPAAGADGQSCAFPAAATRHAPGRRAAPRRGRGRRSMR